MDIIAKSLLGAVMIAAMLALARRGNYVVTGLLVSVPAVSLYTWWWVGKEQGTQALRVAVRAAMWSAIPWVMYLGIVYILAGRFPLWLALLCGVLAYLAVASVFLLVYSARAHV
jgi:membrane protein GlpM